MSEPPDRETTPRIKRKRVSHACNLCRSRKVRCDEQMPTCGNCLRAGAPCVTTDPRNPETPVKSRRRSALPETSAPGPSQPGDETEIAHQLLAMEQTIRASPLQAAHSSISTTSPLQRNPVFDPSHPISPENAKLSGRTPGNESADLAVNAGVNDGSKRKYMGASSLQVLTQWLDLSFSAFGMEKTPSAHFRFGMTGSEEVSLPLSNTLPQLPPLSERESCVSTFFSRIHPMFPLLDEVAFRNTVNRLADADLNNLPPSDRPLLACAYGVISIGADERAGTTTENGTKYFTAAFSLYAHLVAYPYRSSVQAILILVLALRGRNKDGSAWDVHGQAVRLAQSIGLHRKVLQVHASDDPELDSRVWWVTYCLDKIMGFESGRPTAINDTECDQLMPAPVPINSGQRAVGQTTSPANEPDFFNALIGLAKTQSAISTRLFQHQPTEKPIEAQLQATGELDQALSDWAETVPLEIRPGRDIFCAPHLYPFAGFLSLQFHETMVMLHRAGLLLDPKFLRRQLEIHCPGSHWNHRLQASEAICVSSARAIIKVLNDLLNTHGQSRLVTLTLPLLATFVLAIQSLKHPSAWLADSDLGLLTTAAKYTEYKYSEFGQDPQFCRMLTVLREFASQQVSKACHKPNNPIATPFSIPLPLNGADDGGMDILNNSEAAFNSNFSNGNLDMFDDTSLWNRIFGEDLNEGVEFSGEINFEEAFSLFGLPWVGNKDQETNQNGADMSVPLGF